MEPLKEMFNQAYYTRLATAVKEVYKPFDNQLFLKQVLKPLASLSLNERMRHTSVVLHDHLPPDYKKQIAILRKVITRVSPGYTALVFPDFVSQFGTHDVETSLDALKYFTTFGSSEFAIRTFLKKDFNTTIKTLYKCAEDKNEHVRRLASEGSRPRLPWSFKLDAVIENPKHTYPILEKLKQDDSLYVRKSVANHINDISKDAPDLVLQLIKGWDQTNPHTKWIVKRGCRTLFKAGDKKSLLAFNYTKDVQIAVKKFEVTPTAIRIGDVLTFQFEIVSQKKSVQRLMIDYRIHYVKKTGALSPKVFKLKEIDLQPGAQIKIIKKQRFVDFTTRKHFSGHHLLEILVNGEVVKKEKFVVR